MLTAVFCLEDVMTAWLLPSFGWPCQLSQRYNAAGKPEKLQEGPAGCVKARLPCFAT